MEHINKIEFAKIVMDKTTFTFIMHIIALKTTKLSEILVYQLCATQILVP